MREPNEQQVNLTRLTGTQEEMRAMPRSAYTCINRNKTESNQNKMKPSKTVTEISRMSFTM